MGLTFLIKGTKTGWKHALRDNPFKCVSDTLYIKLIPSFVFGLSYSVPQSQKDFFDDD